jgi:hypothetical protein
MMCNSARGKRLISFAVKLGACDVCDVCVIVSGCVFDCICVQLYLKEAGSLISVRTYSLASSSLACSRCACAW